MPRALELGGTVVGALKAGSPLWCRLMGGLLTGYLLVGQQQHAARAIESLLRTSPEPEAIAAYTEAVVQLGSAATLTGSRQQAERSLGRLEELDPAVMEHDALAHGWMNLLKEQFLCFFEVRPWQVYLAAEQAERDFRAVGMERNVSIARARVGFALAALGELPRAVELLRETMADARRSEQQLMISHVRHYFTHVLLKSFEPAHQQEAHALTLEWMACDEPDAFRRGAARAQMAKSLLVKGELREAETHARQACELLMPLLVPFRVHARTVLGTILLAQGHATEARQVAVLGVRDLEQMRSQGVFAVAMHLVLAEACLAEGDTEAGEAALREALRCVHARASDIPEAAARERFLSQVPENARTLELARQRWVEATV